jgi:hypothetical protein
MRRTLKLAVFATAAVVLGACASPTAPASLACQDGKVPYATCPNKDYINPAGDYINPAGDYINPAGNYVRGR